MEISIYTANVTPLTDAALFGKYLSSAPEWRKNSVLLTSRDGAKRLSLGVSALFAAACRDHGVDPATPVALGEHGKPCFKDGGFYFNLSHSGERALCITADAPVGCDIERIAEPNYRIAARFFTDAENDFLDSVGDADEKKLCFYRMWTRKESVLKAIGVGFLAGYADVSVEPGAPAVVYGGKRYGVYDAPSPEGYAVSYAVEGTDVPHVAFHEVDLADFIRRTKP